MAHTIDSVSICGLRKAHLDQLIGYIRDQDGTYYGRRDYFEQRHADLLKFADQLEAIINDPDVRVAGKD